MVVVSVKMLLKHDNQDAPVPSYFNEDDDEEPPPTPLFNTVSS
jgi:hypothetical protein